MQESFYASNRPNSSARMAYSVLVSCGILDDVSDVVSPHICQLKRYEAAHDRGVFEVKDFHVRLDSCKVYA